MNTKPIVHFADNYLLRPTNPIIVNIIGAGGTGSQVLTAMARINHSLVALGHPGLWIQLFDDDIISEANLGRQLFAQTETGLNKAVVLINRINRFFGTNWKAIPYRFSKDNLKKLAQQGTANIILSCVDTVAARFAIADLLLEIFSHRQNDLYKPLYWMDFGNSKDTGQVILSTIGEIKQPVSKKYQTVSALPFITEQYKDLLIQSEEADNTPSCSLAEALTKQDLFINTSLASMGASLLWNLFREGMINNRGFFMNLKDFRTQPIKVA
jgi:PRTRC genetic system ThiF family protein